MHKRDTHKIRRKDNLIRSYEAVEKAVKDTVRDSASSMKTVNRLDSIFVESMKADSWGDTTIYTLKGYIRVQVKTGFFSTKSGKKAFTATVKAETGEILSINWEPGEIS